jgi:L-aspartate oxidase
LNKYNVKYHSTNNTSISTGETVIRNFTENLKFDVAIIGEGISGLAAAYYLPRNMKIGIFSKADFKVSSTWMAQGGIAASISKFDSPESHLGDTLDAGDGLCDEEVARIVVTEGRKRVVEMIRLGVPFERIDDEFDLAREGGHSIARILHFSDRTGEAIVRTLKNYLNSADNIQFFENFYFENLILDESGSRSLFASGIFTDSHQNVLVEVDYFIVATGGASFIFQKTTNPSVATGDGMGVLFRAGCPLSDMEFVQFHPTVLKDDKSPTLLITEAARGRGARLLKPDGEPLMENIHDLGDLAPRSVIVRRMAEVMQNGDTDYFLLDMRHFSDDDFLHLRYMTEELKRRGFDPRKEPIPVFPAAHYFIGGVVVDHEGRTCIENVYACGEVTSTGLHGANRLASNSLLEALVFARRIARSIESSERKERKLKKLAEFGKKKLEFDMDYIEKKKSKLRDLMWKYAGIIRTEEGLEEAARFVDDWFEDAAQGTCANPKIQEFLNMVVVSKALLEMALKRRESRGVHYRGDFPERDDENFRFRQVIRRVGSCFYQLGRLA